MITEELYSDYLSKLLSGDREGCKLIVTNLLNDGIQVRELYENLFQRSMYEVGTLWETNKISVALEHLSTSITESLVNLAYPLIFSAEHNGRRAVITCTPGEYHQLGARMVADYFEMNGWDGYFVGAETSVKELYKIIEEKNPDILAVSMSVYFNLLQLSEFINYVSHKYPNLTILLGGQGFRWGGDTLFKDLGKVYVIHSLKELEERIKNIL
jgi:methanogenic corrinoid protein MtbC1